MTTATNTPVEPDVVAHLPPTDPYDYRADALDAEDWRTLSSVERAALVEIEGEEATDTLREAAGVQIEDPDALPEEEAPEPPPPDPNAVSPVVAAAVLAAQVPEAAPAPPPSNLPSSATLAQQMTALKAEQDALFDRWENLDETLSRDAYKAEMDRLAAEHAGLIVQANAVAASEAQAMDGWNATVTKVMGAYGLDDPQHFDGWDATLRAVDAESKGQLTDAQIIDRAVQRYAVLAHSLGRPISLKDGAQIAPVAAAPAPGPVAPKPGARPELPPTLQRMPASGLNSGNDSRFAHVEAIIDRARDPRQAEAAIGAMSEDDFDELVGARSSAGY